MEFQAFVIIVAAVVIILIMTASRNRRNFPFIDQRACPSCGAGHPGFARYCRRCGQRL
jgi:ribosomal protein L40E